MKIEFEESAWEKLRNVLNVMRAKYGDKEVSGFGRLTVVDNETIVCDDIDVPRQEVSGGSTDISGTQLMQWREERFDIRSGMSVEEVTALNDELQRWWMWWHSHGNMSASFSKTDDNTIEYLARAMGKCLGLVVKSDLSDYKPYIFLTEPVELFVTLDKKHMDVPEDQLLLDEDTLAMVKDRVSVWKYKGKKSHDGMTIKNIEKINANCSTCKTSQIATADIEHKDGKKQYQKIVCLDCMFVQNECDCGSSYYNGGRWNGLFPYLVGEGDPEEVKAWL